MPSFIEAFVIHISERMLREKELCDAARFERAGLALVLQTKSSAMVLHERCGIVMGIAHVDRGPDPESRQMTE